MAILEPTTDVANLARSALQWLEARVVPVIGGHVLPSRHHSKLVAHISEIIEAHGEGLDGLIETAGGDTVGILDAVGWDAEWRDRTFFILHPENKGVGQRPWRLARVAPDLATRPENVGDLLVSLRLIAGSEVEVAEDEGDKGSEAPPNHNNTLRPWTQSALDLAILERKSKRAPRYNELVEQVQKGMPGAQKAAQELFGRNAIAKALGVKSPGMVGRSKEWHKIADELGLPRKRGTVQKSERAKKVSEDIAQEQQAEAQKQPTFDRAIRNETVSMIQDSQMRENEKADTIEKLERGGMTDDAARELIEICADQQKHDKRSVSHQKP